MRRNLFILAIAVFAAAGCAEKTVKTPAAVNPLLSAFDTPFGVPPFDKINPEHFMPAFEKGMADQKLEIEAIVKSTEAPTFANTIEALDRSGSLLDRTTAVFENLNSSNTNDDLQKIAREIAPRQAKHSDDIALDPRLFARVKPVYEGRAAPHS